MISAGTSRPDRAGRDRKGRPAPGGAVPGRAAAGRAAAGKLGQQGRVGPHRSRYGLLLIVIIATYLLSAFISATWVNGLQLLLFLVAIVLAVRSGSLPRRTAYLVLVVAIGGTVAAAALLVLQTGPVTGIANLWAALLLLCAAVLIVRRILAMTEVTQQSIYGAVSAYMIIGLMFASIYVAMNKFSGGTFFANGQTGSVKTFQYFSFTTLTTLGYGDYTAVDNGGRAVAVMEALLGQIFLATLVARLVASFRRPAQPAWTGERPQRTWRTRARALAARRPVLTRSSSHARARPARRSRARRRR